jgi:hypothetical protein
MFGEALEMKSNVDIVSICSDDTADEVEWGGMGSFERRSMIGMAREICVRDGANRRGTDVPVS